MTWAAFIHCRYNAEEGCNDWGCSGSDILQRKCNCYYSLSRWPGGDFCFCSSCFQDVWDEPHETQIVSKKWCHQAKYPKACCSRFGTVSCVHMWSLLKCFLSVHIFALWSRQKSLSWWAWTKSEPAWTWSASQSCPADQMILWMNVVCFQKWQLISSQETLSRYFLDILTLKICLMPSLLHLRIYSNQTIAPCKECLIQDHI